MKKQDRFSGPLSDPTYNRETIRENPEWDLAFVLSEIRNDDAPIGWSQYISDAQCLLAHYEIKERVLEEHE